MGLELGLGLESGLGLGLGLGLGSGLGLDRLSPTAVAAWNERGEGGAPPPAASSY